jgi:hypothetical protein
MPDSVYWPVQSTRSEMIVRDVKTAVEMTANGAPLSVTTGNERMYTTYHRTVREEVDERLTSVSFLVEARRKGVRELYYGGKHMPAGWLLTTLHPCE